MRNKFEIRCSREIFTDEEIEILENHGRFINDLLEGKLTTNTEAQKHFIAVTKGEVSPVTNYEKVWMKYTARLQWEEDPANRNAMGEKRRVHDDRKDWKKMRSGNYSDYLRRKNE